MRSSTRRTGPWRMAVGVAAAALAAHPAAGQQAPAPAGVGGAWEITFGPAMGGRVWTLELQGTGGTFRGTLDMGQLGSAPVEEATLARDKVRFQSSFRSHGHGGTLVFEGTLTGTEIKGEMSGLPSGAVPFTAKRKAG